MEKENRYIKLSRQDVSAGVEHKGGLSYLSWAYCMDKVSEHDDQANFFFAEPTWYPDETVMVKAVVTIDGKTMEQTLPVMCNRNRAIKNPDARAISDAQQRALVKCCALFGVGISLYLGEDLKHVVEHTDFEKAQQFIDAGDYMSLHQFVKGLSEKDQIELFNNAPSGQKTKFKESHRAAIKQAEDFLNSVAEAMGEAVENDDAILLAETIDELTTYERRTAWQRLSLSQQNAVKELRTQQEVSA